MSERLDMWFEGWRIGDAAMILRSVTDDFLYDDAVDGRFTKAEFGAYLEGLFAGSEGHAAAADGEGFETITDVVTEEKDGVETAWGWWTAPPLEGAGLVKARPDGVYLEKVAYYTRPESG